MRRAERSALVVLGACGPLALAATVAGGRAGAWLLAAAAVATPAALIALGAARFDPRIARFALGFGIWMGLAAAAVLALPAGSPTWLGLPLPTLAMLVGLGLAPLVVVPWVHARGPER